MQVTYIDQGQYAVSTSTLYDIELRNAMSPINDTTPIINHSVMECSGIDSEFLNSSEDLVNALDIFCKSIKLSAVERRVHNFDPIGKTIFYVLEESHVSVHTWPELNYLHLDLVTCAHEDVKASKVAEAFQKCFKPKQLRYIKLNY